ncbi:hypothetical protein [Flavobacterium wongokense]|uniref:hypothetical protein n=1 Tax=Flavobacterium wongokense TaxID=2910674 RepID=UPI001F1DA183|nr:hypothetical protein [Flavobacterium sp. WG47]MCF6131304.1 hypothetical protein [Flavobacterium sp. WG47]
MKNLLFGIIATILFAFNGNAQKVTQEELRLILAQGMADFTSSLKPAFEKSKNVEDFKKRVTGNWYSKIPTEGNDLLEASYELLSKKTSNDDILKNYNGKEMAVAALYIDSLSKKGVQTDGTELFGGTTGDFNPYSETVSAKCRWYQLACWIKEIFGDGGGQIIVDGMVQVVRDLLSNIRF